MSVTGSGQTRNPFTLYTSSSSLPSRSLLFFPYTTSMAWVYYTHTQKSYRNSWWKSRQRAIWLIAVILPTQNAGSIHIIDRQYPRVPPKKEEKASWQTEWGMAPPQLASRISIEARGNKLAIVIEHSRAGSGVVRCRLDSDSVQRKCSFIATCSFLLSLSQSVRLLYGATCVCAAKDIVSELSISFFF